MIPYAVLMLKFIWTEPESEMLSGKTHSSKDNLDFKHEIPLEKKLEVRVLEPTEDGVIFRVSKEYLDDKSLKILPDKLICSFLNFKDRRYETVELDSYEFRLELKNEHEASHNLENNLKGGFEAGLEDEKEEYIKVRLYSTSEIFIENLRRVSKEYMDYINLVMENDEIAVMEKLGEIRLSEKFPESLREWQENQIKYGNIKICKNEPRDLEEPKLNNVELVVSLDMPKIWNKFCELELDEFLRLYWHKNGLENHFIAEKKVTHIYIGNQFCPLLFPDKNTFERIVRKAEKCGLVPVIVFSTMPENMVEKYERRIDWIKEYSKRAEEKRKKQKFDEGESSDSAMYPVEIVINDLGILLMMEEELSNYKFTLGVLLNKRKKDARVAWKYESEEYIYSEIRNAGENTSTVDSSIYRDYLKNRFGIRSVSYEATGKKIKITGNENVLHLPLYQMNTSGYCTLYAICKNGSRDRQEQVENCPHYCEHYQVMYPENMPVIGRFNSIFGCSMREINDADILNSYIENGIKRLVVRM